VCEVMGHSWGESYHSNDGFTTDWNTWIRACHICGKQESKSMNDWK